MRTIISLLVLAVLSSACAGEDAAKDPVEGGPGGKGDAWNATNDPDLFGIDLETRLDALPREGRSEHVPWSETYWPTMDDSFNVRWHGAGTLSPLEKYDMAFNGWEPPPGFMALRPLTTDNCASGAWDPEYYEQLGPAAKYWSDTKGNGRARDGLDTDGDGKTDECDDLDGMEGWWGSCHAWTPASILEEEPLEPVEINGVRFEVSDIKALLIMLYEESRQIALGNRCNLDNPTRDETGRIIEEDCRDTNAGAFHLLMTNVVGIHKRPFGEDRVSGRQVWNQPILGYEVTSLEEVDEAKAVQLVRGTGDAYPHNDEAVRFAHVRADLDYVFETHASTEPTTGRIDEFIRTDNYEYLLEMDAEGHVIGGEWMQGTSDTSFAVDDRPDFLWLPLGPGRNPNPEVSVANVRQLQRQSIPELRNLDSRTYTEEIGDLIPDWPGTGLKGRIEVDEDLVAEDVTIHVNILHDWIYDVSVKLRRNGEEHVLFNRNPRGASINLVADFPVEALRGESIAGTWELVVTDHDGRSRGRFLDWGISATVQGVEPKPNPDPEPEPEPIERTYASTGSPMDIPDADPTGIGSTITIPADVVVEGLTVRVEIAHTYRADLRVVLEHGGVRQVLHDRQGGAADNLSLELEASDFQGAKAAGEWTLRVSDHANLDSGQLQGWSLDLRGR